MRLATAVLAVFGALSALPTAAGAYIRQSEDLAPFSLFPRTYEGRARPEVTVSPDKNTGADAAVFMTQPQDNDEPVILGDFLSPERTAQLQKMLVALDFSGDAGSTVKIAGADGDPAGTLIFTGIGETVTNKTIRGAATFGVRAAMGRAKKVAVMLPKDHSELISFVAEGAVSGTYVWDKYLSRKAPPIDCIVIVSDCEPEKIKRAVTVAYFVNYARDLVNEPPNVLYPESFVQIASDIAIPAGISVDVWDEDRLRGDRLGAILAIGSGSDHKPRLLKLSYTPQSNGKRNNWKHVVFVGGGITYDSGGLSLKATADMAVQRGDMAGAAAALKAILAAHELNINTRITAWIPLAENLAGGGGMRVGDIVTTYRNHTFEIVNTDAESRLLMADAIGIARTESHDAMISISTYTDAGKQPDHASLGGNEADGAIKTFKDEDGPAAQRPRSERALALYSEYTPSVAEFSNGGYDPLDTLFQDALSSGQWGGGNKVRRRSLEKNHDTFNPVHIDLGGLAWNPGAPYLDQPSLGTGVGVKTLVAIAEQYAV